MSKLSFVHTLSFTEGQITNISLSPSSSTHTGYTDSLDSLSPSVPTGHRSRLFL